jgi:asparagine synthase (glutamine-hydrolysing)
MGAIAAVLRTGGDADSRAAERMLAAAPHRGLNTKLVSIGSAALGIGWGNYPDEVDLAANDRYAVVFHGKLDDILAPETDDLPAAAPALRLLAIFERHGARTPQLMRGIYAVVVTDGTKIWCWRDHLAFRSLFYRAQPDGFFAASEVKQVIAGAGITKEPDIEVLQQIFYGTYDDSTPAALKGVHRLPKSTLLQVPPSMATSEERYWHPEQLLETSRLDPDELKTRFDDLMAQAVGRSMFDRDVVSLSGGIDSPAIAAYAAPIHLARRGARLAALSAVYPRYPSVDETEYIEAVARSLDLHLHRYVPETGLHERLREYVEIADGPVPTVALEDLEEAYRKATELGYRTILGGEVAEFVFDMRRYLTPHLVLKGRFATVKDRLVVQTSGRTSWLGAMRALGRDLLPAPLARVHTRIRHAGLRVPDWLSEERIGADGARGVVPARQRWRDQQLRGFIGPGLTIEADEILQSIHGVQMRRPWADVDLWEFFLSLPAEVKFPDNGAKTLVRQLLRGRVPDVVLDRKDKTLFTEFTMARVNYPALRHWLWRPKHRMPDIDYERLALRLEHEDMDPLDFRWAKDLAAVHAFLDLW